MKEMDAQTKLSRSQFIAMLGSAAAGFALMKAVDSKKAVSMLLSKRGSLSASAAYGNNVYGGKRT